MYDGSVGLAMPASQTVNYTRYGYLKISVEPIDEPDSVYFTDQSPSFRMIFENISDRTITSRDGRDVVKWFLALGSDGQMLNSGSIDFSIGPGEIHEEVIEPGLLAYEENAVLGIGSTALIGNHQNDEDPIQFSPSQSERITKELYSFPVWDRSHYRAIHEQPKQMTKWVMFFGGLTAVLAVIQIALISARMT